MKTSGYLPDGCIDPSDMDYYERVNGPFDEEERVGPFDEEDDGDEEEELPPEKVNDEEYQAWLEWIERRENGYQDACRLGS